MAMLEQIDDTDARIVYSQGWIINNNPQQYNHTSHATNKTGAAATLKFKGMSIKVYGTLVVGLVPTLDTPKSSYTIDNGSPATHQDTDLVSLPQTLYGQLFFQTSVFMDPNVEHTLVITLLDSRGGNFYIDRIDVGTTSTVPTSTQVPSTAPAQSTVVITTSITTSESSTSPSTTSPSIFSSSSSESMTSRSLNTTSQLQASPSFLSLTDNRIASSVSPTSSQTSSTELASTSDKGISESTTIGIVLGTCIPAVALIIMGIFYLRRRRQRKPVHQSTIPYFPIRSDWPSPKTTTTASMDVVPSPGGRNVSVQTSRWQIVEPFPLHHENVSDPSGASRKH